jgi:hypothetical protein
MLLYHYTTADKVLSIKQHGVRPSSDPDAAISICAETRPT